MIHKHFKVTKVVRSYYSFIDKDIKTVLEYLLSSFDFIQAKQKYETYKRSEYLNIFYK